LALVALPGVYAAASIDLPVIGTRKHHYDKAVVPVEKTSNFTAPFTSEVIPVLNDIIKQYAFTIMVYG
jgi:hypothetical protein